MKTSSHRQVNRINPLFLYSTSGEKTPAQVTIYCYMLPTSDLSAN